MQNKSGDLAKHVLTINIFKVSFLASLASTTAQKDEQDEKT